MEERAKAAWDWEPHNTELVKLRPSCGSEQGSPALGELSQAPAGNAKSKIEAQYQEIDRLIGEVLVLVDLLFINHKVTVCSDGIF